MKLKVTMQSLAWYIYKRIIPRAGNGMVEMVTPSPAAESVAIESAENAERVESIESIESGESVNEREDKHGHSREKSSIKLFFDILATSRCGMRLRWTGSILGDHGNKGGLVLRTKTIGISRAQSA